MNELFSSAAWAAVLTATYGFDLRRAVGIPYCLLDDPAGRRISALPFSDYLPIDTPATCTALLRELRECGNHPITLKSRLAAEEASCGFFRHQARRISPLFSWNRCCQ